MTLFFAVSAVTVEKRDQISSINSKSHGKRGVYGLEYGYQQEHGGQIYGPPIVEPAPIHQVPAPVNEYPVPAHQEHHPSIFFNPVGECIFNV